MKAAVRASRSEGRLSAR